METVEIIALLQPHFDDGEVKVNSDGGHVNILIVSDKFADLNRIKRQQAVYALLNEQIADGSIHAVNMKTFTHAEWAAQ